MILVDTSVWIDHLRGSDETLAQLLHDGRVLGHPFIAGELAVGNLRQRDVVLDAVDSLPQAEIATDREVLQFIDRFRLFGLGIGYIDAHLLAAVRLTKDALLWTRDTRLLGIAAQFGLSAGLPNSAQDSRQRTMRSGV